VPTYDPPDGSYSQSIPSGTRAFRQEIAAHFGFTRTEVVRDLSRCQHQRSEHCECRGIDFFTTDVSKGRKVFDFCIRNADVLDIQSVIFNRRVWGFGTWTERAYSGPSPHTDHVHVGLNKRGARTLTREKIRTCLQGGIKVRCIKLQGDLANHVYADFEKVLVHLNTQDFADLGSPAVVDLPASDPTWKKFRVVQYDAG
jgi:hypothetical protein